MASLWLQRRTTSSYGQPHRRPGTSPPPESWAASPALGENSMDATIFFDSGQLLRSAVNSSSIPAGSCGVSSIRSYSVCCLDIAAACASSGCRQGRPGPCARDRRRLGSSLAAFSSGVLVVLPRQIRNTEDSHAIPEALVGLPDDVDLVGGDVDIEVLVAVPPPKRVRVVLHLQHAVPEAALPVRAVVRLAVPAEAPRGGARREVGRAEAAAYEGVRRRRRVRAVARS